MLQCGSKSRHEALVVTIVTTSVTLFLVAGCMCLSFMFSIMLPSPIATWVIQLHLRLLRLLPANAYDWVIGVLAWVSLISLSVAVCMSLIGGIRAMRQVGPSHRRIRLAACGGILAVLLCAGPMALYSSERALLDRAEAAGRAADAKLRNRLEQGAVSSTHRKQLWQVYAQGVYLNQGVSVEIPDERGGKTLYQPTESDIAARQGYAELRAGFLPPYRFTVFAIGLVAMSIALGVLTPVSARPPDWPGGGAPANNRLKPPAGGGLAAN